MIIPYYQKINKLLIKMIREYKNMQYNIYLIKKGILLELPSNKMVSS